MPVKHIKTLIKLFIYFILIVASFFVLPKVLRFFLPFVIGWIIACIASPLVKFFEKNLKVMRKHGSWLVIIGVLGIVLAGGYFLGVAIVRELVSFVDSLPDSYSTFTSGLTTIIYNLSSYFPNSIINIDEMVASIVTNLDATIGNLISKFGSPALDVAKNVPHLLVMSIFTLLAAYFFVTDKEQMMVALKRQIPSAFIEKWNWVKKMFSRAVGGYFVAQFKIMGVIALILWIGLMLLDVNYSILWAILIALLDFLPFFGTGFVIWPWCVYEFLMGNYSMVLGLFAVYLVCLLVHQILQPKFVGSTVGMDSFTTLLCMFIGYRISSVIGMIVAVPIGIIVINLYKEGFFSPIIQDIKDMINDFHLFLKSE